MQFWVKTSGTWINIATIFLGTSLGLLMRRNLSKHFQEVITQGIGLLTFWLGINMAGSFTEVQAGAVDGVVLGLLAMVGGGILGEWWQVERRLTALGDWLKRRFRGQGKFTEGFVAASLIFCIGPMALLGSLNNGLRGDNALLVLKATMDGIISIPLTSSYGLGVGFSALPVLVYQGGLSLSASLLAGSMSDPSEDPRIALITGVGGLMIMGIGINLLEITKIRVASFLPALLLAPLIYWLAVSFD